MFYQPEAFAYLMLLPVTALVIIPALLSTIRSVIGMLRTAKVEVAQDNFGQAVLVEA